MSRLTFNELDALVSQTTQVAPTITRPTNDVEASRESSSLGEKAAPTVIQIIDAPFDGAEPQHRERFSFNDKNIGERMKSLPPHEPGTARILDITVHSDFIEEGLRSTKGPQSTQEARHALMTFLHEAYARPGKPYEERRIFRWLSDPLLVNDIGSISAQWAQSLGGDKNNLYRLVNRTSLQQHPLDDDVKPRDSYMTCAQDANNRLIVIIVNEVWSDQEFRTASWRFTDEPIEFENPRIISTMMKNNGDTFTSFSDGKLDTFAKLLVLEFFLSSIYLQPVDYYGDLIYPQLSDKDVVKFSLTGNPHLQVPLGLFEPRLSATSKEAFKEIEDAEGILRSVNNLVDSINFVIEKLKQNNVPASQQPHRKEYKSRMQNLVRLCKERRENAKRALEALERQLDYLTKRHAIREAKSLRVLTILASFYLPLTLAASVLSMQNPFRVVAHTVTEDRQNLIGTNLLFDFFGVFIGLASVTIFITYAIRAGASLKANGLRFLSSKPRRSFSFLDYGRRWRYGRPGGTVFKWVRRATGWWLGVGLPATLLTIFMVGMLRTAQNAWDTAWRMFAVYLSVGGFLVLVYVGTYWYLYYSRIRPRQKVRAPVTKLVST